MVQYIRKIQFVCCVLLLGVTTLFAQSKKTYNERHIPSKRISGWQSVASKEALHVAWGSIDKRYAKDLPPNESEKVKELTLTAWRGERVNAQIVLWTTKSLKEVSYKVEDLKKKKGGFLSTATQIESGFVRFVVSDNPKELNKPNLKRDSILVGDVIDPIEALDMDKKTTRSIWISIQVPQTLISGTYVGKVRIASKGEKEKILVLNIHVKKELLPPSSDWEVHLDLWQNPYAIARIHQVETWSEQHFQVMRPYMERLASAGQKVITTTLLNRPWHGQTEDPFNTMVTIMKKVDNSWYYDFTLFDKYVSFMMACGITQQINCYSMLPWDLQFEYLDQATSSFKRMKAAPGTKDYDAFWGPFLTAFSNHLKQKGWFDKTCIAMDERGEEQMKKAIALIRHYAPKMKISLAGNYHASIEPDLYDYCLAIGQTFPNEVLKRRREKGMKSTVYTCCGPLFPNTFTFSSPAEAAFLGWYAAKANFDGYLRWAYNSWTKEPLLDSRFRSWPAGDCFLVYPGNRSSIRFERLIEGMQAFEKYHILYERALKGNNTSLKRKLQAIMALIDRKQSGKHADEIVRKANLRLNNLSK